MDNPEENRGNGSGRVLDAVAVALICKDYRSNTKNNPGFVMSERLPATLSRVQRRGIQ